MGEDVMSQDMVGTPGPTQSTASEVSPNLG